MVGTADSVLIREVSFIRSGLYREVPLYVGSGLTQGVGNSSYGWGVCHVKVGKSHLITQLDEFAFMFL